MPKPTDLPPNTQTFGKLIESISHANQTLTAQVGSAINISLTLRNWLIGAYIEEYERGGKDRADYGDKLMEALAAQLTAQGIARCDRRELYRYRQFYLIYPQIVESLAPQSSAVSILLPALAAQTAPSRIVESPTPQSALSGVTLMNALSFTHFAELIAIDDGTRRNFYEVECLQGNWSVRELKRQINSLYYERSGLSSNKKKLSTLANQKAETRNDIDVRDPYIFEFLGLKPSEVMSESHLEQTLTDKLQAFMLELGHGFCFEARQRRILIGGEHFFVDLVFYHRILKCHVLVELKLQAFSHENIGQLNTYVSWYEKNVMQESDIPPIGILLCTDKNHALAEYALAGMDNQLFVSKYQLELPKEEELQQFINAQLKTTD